MANNGNGRLPSEKLDTIVLIDRHHRVVGVAYNHCLSADPFLRQESRLKVAGWAIEAAQRRGAQLPIAAVMETPGDLLYAALAGHWFTVEHPCRAYVGLALQCRAFIAGRIGQVSMTDRAYAVAHQVVQLWGPFIQPWLGVTKFVDGFPQAWAPEYGRRIVLEGMPPPVVGGDQGSRGVGEWGSRGVG